MRIQNLFSDTESFIDENCIKCGLHTKCKSPQMPVSGEGKKEILLIGECPGTLEDLKGTHWQGQSGDILKTILSLHDIDLVKDCWSTNALCCHIRKKPTKKQIKLCKHNLLKTIEELNPRFILPLGTSATASLLSDFFSKISISKVHGNIIPVNEYNAFVLPLTHPSYILRNPKDKNLKSMYDRDIKKAVDFINSDPNFIPYKLHLNDVYMLTKIEEVKLYFKQLFKTTKPVAFDYETTGLKPFITEHKVTSMSISSEFGTFSFPVDYQKHWNDDEFTIVWDLIIEFLSSNLYKIAQNSKFEKLWSEEIFEVRPVVDWCTMDTQHILDHRTGITGLKFQSFVRWGVYGYDKTSKKYIKSESSNDFNKMDEMPLGEQLLYVALDAKLTRKLYFEQKSEMTDEMEVGRKLFRDVSDVFLDMQINGLPVDEEHYANANIKLTNKINNLTNKLKNYPEILTYNKENEKVFSETSSKNLQKLLFEQMNIVSTKKTPGGSPSVDAEVLTEIDNNITNSILEKRKLLKLRDTYLAQFKRECVDEYINPNFTLHIARSFRSSAKNPNLQNVPKRDKLAKEIIRKGIIPSPDRVLMEADFSGIEVSVSALYHKDPNFINYLISDNSDMHSDLTLQLWNITKEQLTKELRFFTKNCWTFPQFYGDYYGSCAPNLWKNCVDGKLPLKNGTSLMDHLRKLKLHTLHNFTNHCKDVEYDMWNNRFKVYTQWKNKINDFYIKNGYVETYFGFKFTDYLDKKQTTNYPVQSTAAHLLFWSLIQTTKKIREQSLDAVMIGQIHDSMILDVPVQEVDRVVKIIKQVCENDLGNNFKWVTIPMKVEIEISKSFEEGGSFANMEEI